MGAVVTSQERGDSDRSTAFAGQVVDRGGDSLLGG
jgi:hypothetical protein